MIRSKRKRIGDIFTAVFIVLIFGFVTYGIVLRINNNDVYLFGYRTDVVLSDSMSYKNSDPKVQEFLKGHDDQFNKGDLIYSVKINTDTPIEVYDVVTFVNPTSGKLTTHRVVEIVKRAGKMKYRIRADAANYDSYDAILDKTDLIAKKVGQTPWLGYVLDFLHSIFGMVMLVGLAILLAVYSYFSSRSDRLEAAAEEGKIKK